MRSEKNSLDESSCLICGSKHQKIFLEIPEVPVFCNLLWESRKAALKCPKGDIKLAFCPNCGYIYNIAFDPSLVEYSHYYENSLFFSFVFQDYAQSQALRLIDLYNLYNKNIIEIGCGKGNFLILLCKLGNNNGVGFDISYVEQKNHIEMKEKVKFIKDFYSDTYKKYKADLIVCRQVLEHIYNPKEFLYNLRKIIADRQTNIFFEVPNALHTIYNLYIWDIIYEHCSYFTPSFLSYLFSTSGFNVNKITTYYENQYLGIDAHTSMSSKYADTLIENKVLIKYIDALAFNYRDKTIKIEQKIIDILEKGKRVVLWGAGSKGTSFLNTYKRLEIEYAIDINPRKQGKYISGTGQKIVSPIFLKNYKPDVIIVMNPLYENEIKNILNNMKLKNILMNV